MAQQLIRMCAPSGAQLDLGLSDESRLLTSASTARFVGSRFARAFDIGPTGYFDMANQSIMPARVIDRFVVDGREVRVAQTEDELSASVAMLDQWHEVMTVYGGVVPTREEVMELFTQFEVRDTPEGMTINPRPGTGLELSAESIVTYAENRGSLSIPGPSTAANIVPTFRGAPTPYGEVWKSEGSLPDREGEGANTFIYIVGTTRGVAEVIFEYRPTVDDRTLLDWLSTISVRWS
ncbi:MAG TPA: hypothetical protein VFC19_05950 [Candidatus Limnocylindrales bacterium]|nr:hypothetical protein [Candidatus Limnocylindrales bacterium]